MAPLLQNTGTVRHGMRKKNMNPLIVILSCQKNANLWDKLKAKSPNSIIFCGDPKLSSNYLIRDRILYLKCEDTYDHLPSKIYMMISAILEIEMFSTITHIFKKYTMPYKIFPQN